MRKSAANADVLSTREAAERLGVALRTVQLWVEGGVLPAWKTAGGHRRISRTAVEQLIAERAQALQGHPSSATLAASGGRRGGHLLVVEDDPQLLELYALMIEGWDLDLEVTTAADGFQALLRIGDRCPDLLLTDLRMPGMDGFRMIRALREHRPAGKAMRIVVVSALDDAEVAAHGGLPPDVTVFGKPVDFNELEALVRRHFQSDARSEVSA
ncbi:MAG: response regulator [Aquabacterium sp.]|nr:response regulator [Aquabacterium sp.]